MSKKVNTIEIIKVENERINYRIIFEEFEDKHSYFALMRKDYGCEETCEAVGNYDVVLNWLNRWIEIYKRDIENCENENIKEVYEYFIQMFNQLSNNLKEYLLKVA